MANMEDHHKIPLPLSIGTGPLLAPEARSPKFAGPDEPVTLLTSPQVTPAALGFLPLTREVTPLHSAFNPSAGALDFSFAIQRLANQMFKGSSIGVIGEDSPDAPEQPGAGGGEANGDWDPLTSPAFVFRGAVDEGRTVLPGVAEEPAAAVLGPSCSDLLQESDRSTTAPAKLGMGEDSLLSPLTPLVDNFGAKYMSPQDYVPLVDNFGAKYMSPKEDFCATFMNTPESTPLHVGFLSSSFGEGQRFRYDGCLGGQLPGEAAPGPPTLAGGCCSTPEDVPSVGSAGHPLLCARPCKYAGKPRGCKDGRYCTRCHLCSWRRVAEKQVGSQRGPLAAVAG